MVTIQDKRFQIFISSTFEDLKETRKAIIDQTILSGHFPRGMESFSAGIKEDLEVITRAIEQCDIYVVLGGYRFGSKIKPDGPSYTQEEFRIAQNLNKPILAFLLNEDEFSKRRNSIAINDPERQHDQDIIQFREEVKRIKGYRQRIVSFFSQERDGLGELKAAFSTALENLIRDPDFSARGWIQGADYESFSLPPEIDKNQFIRKIVQKLSEFNTLSERVTNENQDLKEEMAQFFWRHYLGDIIRNNLFCLFFGPGSTVVYLVAEFREYLKTRIGEAYRKKWKIRTNNVLAFLLLYLWEAINLRSIPYGPPEKKYGGTLGDLEECPPVNFPDKPTSLSDEESNGIKNIIDGVFKKANPHLLFITSSGLETDLRSEFAGLHVGNFYSKLFTRCAFMTNKPVILFMDESKILPNFEKARFTVGNCYAIFDPTFSWEEYCKNSKFAVCSIARTKENQEKIIEYFARLDFSCHGTNYKNYKYFPMFFKSKKFDCF